MACGGSDLCEVQHFILLPLAFPHISAVDRWNFLGCDNWTNCTVKQCKKQSSNPVFAIYSANQPWLPIWLIFYTVLYCKIELKQIQQQEKGPGCESAVVFHRTVIPTSVPNYCDWQSDLYVKIKWSPVHFGCLLYSQLWDLRKLQKPFEKRAKLWTFICEFRMESTKCLCTVVRYY